MVALGCNVSILSDEDTCRLALWCFAIYKAHNYLRHNHISSSIAEDMIGLLNGFLREGVEGSEDGMHLLEYGWRHDFRFAGEVLSDDSSGWEFD